MAVRWSDAFVGDSHGLTIRVTDEEKERLEQLRRQHGLTSKAQVVRLALDLLELANRPGQFLVSGPEGLQQQIDEWPEIRDWYVEWAQTGVKPPLPERLRDGSSAAGSSSADDHHEPGDHK